MTACLTVSQLEEIALWSKRKVLEMAVKANSGHVSTAMSQCEILTVLYFGGILKYDPKNPKWEDRDYFLLSKGQGGIGYYPLLARAGYFPESDLDNFCGEGSVIGVHAEWHCPGTETISGSLGHNLPIATGIAQSLKNDGKDNLVFVMTGDGELHEGSNWEALLTASQLHLDNLILIVDNNDQATLGHLDDYQTPKDGPRLKPLREKLEAFGCYVAEIDGHRYSEIIVALDRAKPDGIRQRHGPYAIIAHTKKGNGLSCMSDKRLWHYKVPSGNDLTWCWEELKVALEDRVYPANTSQAKHAVGMRDAFFEVLYEKFKQDKNLVLIAADNGFPTIEKWAETLPNQFYQVGIAEQQLIGMAAGMALRGKKVFCYAIAPFVTTRVHEFVKLDCAAMNLPVTMVGVGASWAYDLMGPTHHTTEDVAIMRVLPNLTIYSPADGATASAMANTLANSNGPGYIRLDRGGIPELDHPSGVNIEDGLELMKAWKGDTTLIISTGVMTHHALKVAQEVGNCAVVDVFRLKPMPTDHLLGLLHNGIKGVITLEEHRLPGGLGGIVAEIFADCGIKLPLLRIGAEDRFVFELGGRDVIRKSMGLDVPSVTKRVVRWRHGNGI